MEPQTVVELLSIKTYVGNKRREKELGGIINVYEEIGFWHSGLKHEAQMKAGDLVYWNDG